MHGIYTTFGFASFALACGLASAFALGDERAGELRDFVNQKTAALEQINSLLDEAQPDVEMINQDARLSSAAKNHYEAMIALWRAKRSDPQAWGDAWVGLREPHDAALLAFNEHMSTPGGRLIPASHFIELCMEMFGMASRIEYVKRDFWRDASIRDASIEEGKFLPSVVEGDEIVIGLEDGMTRGLRSTAHPYRTLAYITLPADWEIDRWIDLELHETLHMHHFSRYSRGILREEELEHARVRVIDVEQERLRIDLAIVGEFVDARNEDRRKTRIDYRGPLTVHLAELPCR